MLIIFLHLLGFSETNFLPTILYVTNTKEVLEGEEITIFCVSKGKSNTINLFNRSGRYFYHVAKGKSFLKKTIKATQSSTYVCEIEASGIRVKEDFSITVVGMNIFIIFYVLKRQYTFFLHKI